MKERYLIKVRRSRKRYVLFYFMAFCVLGVLIYFMFNDYKINPVVLILSLLYVALTVKLTELHRVKDWWAITDHSLVQSTGIFNKNIREVDFSSISDLDLEKPLFKRIFNYGNVNVRLFLNDSAVKILDINRPEEFVKDLENLISVYRGGKVWN